MVGLFINTLPVRVRIEQGDSLLSLLDRLQNQQLDLLPHKYVGLADIQRLAGFRQLFDTATVFENFPVDADGLQESSQGLGVVDARLEEATHFALGLSTADNTHSLGLNVTYRPDLFTEADAREFGDRLVRILSAFADDPEQRIGGIGVLSADEHHRVLVEWNETGHEVAAATFPALFEAAVAERPQRTAVIAGARKLTYAEPRRAGQPLGEPADRARCRPGGPGRRRRAPVPAVARRHSGRPQGGRGLCARGPGRPRRTPGPPPR